MAGTTEELVGIFALIKESFPHHLTPHGWYQLTFSALITSANPGNVAHLYTYLTSLPEFSTSEQRKVLSRRLREQIFKQWIVSSLPRTVAALHALVRVEKPEDTDPSFTRGGRGPDESAKDDPIVLSADNEHDNATAQRGMALINQVYGEEEVPAIFKAWGSHSVDFQWLAKNVIYGIFWSDESWLNGRETEIVVFAAIMCQDVVIPARRHLRALRRFGLSLEEVEKVVDCVRKIAEWAGKDTSKWEGVREIAPDFKEDKPLAG